MKKVKKKICVVCGVDFTPYNSNVQKACSIKCAMDFAELKLLAKKAKQDNELNILFNEKIEKEKIEKLKKSTSTIVHNYIKKRDKNKPCISCGVPYKSAFQACHAFSQEKYKCMIFDFDNIHGGCIRCNLFLKGNSMDYLDSLPKRIGQERFDLLVKKAKATKEIDYQYTVKELKEIQLKTKEK